MKLLCFALLLYLAEARSTLSASISHFCAEFSQDDAQLIVNLRKGLFPPSPPPSLMPTASPTNSVVLEENETLAPTRAPTARPTPAPTMSRRQTAFDDLEVHQVIFSPRTSSILLASKIDSPLRPLGDGGVIGDLTADEIALLYGEVAVAFAPTQLPDLALAADGSILLQLSTTREDEANDAILGAACQAPLHIWGRDGGTIISGMASAPFLGDDALVLSNETSPDRLDLLDRGDDGVWVYSLPDSFQTNDDAAQTSRYDMPMVCLSHGLGCFHLARWPNANPWTPFPTLPTCANTKAQNCTVDRFLDMVNVAAGSFVICPRDSADEAIVSAAPGQYASWPTSKHDAVRVCGTYSSDQFNVLDRVTGLSPALGSCLQVSTDDPVDLAYASAGKGRVYLEGLRAFFDSPGEFFVDWGSRKLFLYVGPDPSLLGHPDERARVWNDAATAASVRLLVGTDTTPILDLRSSSNVHIRGVTFEGNRGPLVRLFESDTVTLQHVTARYSSKHAVVIRGSSNVRLEDSLVEWCEESGIVLDSGNVRENEYAETIVARTLVRRVGLVRVEVGAVSLRGVGATVVNSTVSESPGPGITVHSGQSHHVSRVRFDRLGSYAASTGAVSAHGSWITTNITMEHLYFSRVDNSRALETSPGATPVRILWLSNAASGITFRSTLATDLPASLTSTMYIDSGRDLHVHDNLFVSSSANQQYQGIAVVDTVPRIESGSLDVVEQLESVDHATEPWLSDFPRVSELPATLDAIKMTGMVKPRYSRIHHNFRLNVTRGNETWSYPPLSDQRSFSSLAQETADNGELRGLSVADVFAVDDQGEFREVLPIADWLPSSSGPIVPVDLATVGVPRDSCIGGYDHWVVTDCLSEAGDEDEDDDLGGMNGTDPTGNRTETPGAGEGGDAVDDPPASSSTGAIVGAVVASVLILLLGVVVVVIVRTKKKRATAGLAVGPTARPGIGMRTMGPSAPKAAPIPVRLPPEQVPGTESEYSSLNIPSSMPTTTRSRSRSRAKSTSAHAAPPPTDHYASIGPPKRVGGDTMLPGMTYSDTSAFSMPPSDAGQSYGGLTLTSLSSEHAPPPPPSPPPPPPLTPTLADGEYGTLQVAPSEYTAGPARFSQTQMT